MSMALPAAPAALVANALAPRQPRPTGAGPEPLRGASGGATHAVAASGAVAALLAYRSSRRNSSGRPVGATGRSGSGRLVQRWAQEQAGTAPETPADGAAPSATSGSAAADAPEEPAAPLSAPQEPPLAGVWASVEGARVLRPPTWARERGVIHFLGGAFASAAPQWAYRRLLTSLAERGFWVVTTPVATSFDHFSLVEEATGTFERAYGSLLAGSLLSEELPVYGMGHSMGSLLSALAACGAGSPEAYRARLQGQVLVSYNAQSLAVAVPGWDQLWTRDDLRPRFRDLAGQLEAVGGGPLPGAAGAGLELGARVARAVGLRGGAAALGGSERVEDLFAPALGQLAPLLRDVAGGVSDFQPSGPDVLERVSADYPSKLRVLLVRFEGDPVDQTRALEGALKKREEQGDVTVKELKGNHASPNFLEPLDPVDGTDAMGRAVIGAESPLDGLLLSAGAELSALIEAADGFLPAARGAAESSGDGASQERKKFPGLRPGDLQHPLDRRATRSLERLPGLGGAVRRVVTLVEQAIYQDNISTSVLVGEQQYPWVHRLLVRACDVLDLPEKARPEVYVRRNPVPNAYTLAAQGSRPFVVVHTALLEMCCEEEVEAVLAHELGHLKCEHGVWQSAASVLLLAASALPLPARVLQPALERVSEGLGAWQRAAELSCDRAALVVAQDPWVVLSVLAKLAGAAPGSGAPSALLPREQLEAFLAQASKYDEAVAESSMLEAAISGAMAGGRPRTHPLPVLRARELRRWGGSEEFQLLLAERARPLVEQAAEEAPAAESEAPAAESVAA